ncbi:hypothetical protein LINPERPRIM_LOCUS4542 [Linum perenne]
MYNFLSAAAAFPLVLSSVNRRVFPTNSNGDLGFKTVSLLWLGCMNASLRSSMLWYKFPRQPTISFLDKSLTTVPSGKENRVKRKSTNSFPASANRTLFPFLSTRSFSVTLEVLLVVSSIEKFK